MHHVQSDAQQWTKASASTFTGDVRLVRYSVPTERPPAGVTAVTFAPAARTYWHSHPNGQILWVVSGTALIVEATGEATLAKPGEVVFAEAGVRHWHGATADESMSHLSITAGEAPDWEEVAVSDDDYSMQLEKALDSRS